MAFVHHTVNANTYTAETRPAIVLAIAKYHINSNGWNDIGYNFLVDRYGQIFEGRAGGIDQAIIGAQAQGFNSYSTGISNIGTFESVAQTDVAINAQAQLIAWKLAIHGVSPEGTVDLVSAGGESNRYASGRTITFQRVSGHRDADKTPLPRRRAVRADPDDPRPRDRPGLPDRRHDRPGRDSSGRPAGDRHRGHAGRRLLAGAGRRHARRHRRRPDRRRGGAHPEARRDPLVDRGAREDRPRRPLHRAGHRAPELAAARLLRRRPGGRRRGPHLRRRSPSARSRICRSTCRPSTSASASRSPSRSPPSRPARASRCVLSKRDRRGRYRTVSRSRVPLRGGSGSVGCASTLAGAVRDRRRLAGRPQGRRRHRAADPRALLARRHGLRPDAPRGGRVVESLGRRDDRRHQPLGRAGGAASSTRSRPLRLAAYSARSAASNSGP